MIFLCDESIIGKVAYSQDGARFGPITREEMLPGRLAKKLECFALILAVNKWRTKITIPIEVTHIQQIEETKVIFDISKEAYDKELQRQIQIDAERKRFTARYKLYRTAKQHLY